MARAPDIIVTNASVLTMDTTRPRAEAVAIAQNRIVAVGTSGEIGALKGRHTQVFEAARATVMPGFNEGHMHLFPGATELDHLSLAGVRGFDALGSAVRSFAATSDATLIIGETTDYTVIGVGEPLTRHHLDRMLPERPLLLYSPDHHTGWANTIALEQAGVLQGRKVGVGNEIVMSAEGLATGELREGLAIEPVLMLSGEGLRYRLGLSTGGDPLPPATAAERAADKATLRRGLAHLARHGITSFQNMDGNPYQLELLRELEAADHLTARGRIPFHFKNFMTLDALETASRMDRDYRGEMVTSGFVKLFVDGVIDSSTAVMIDGYADQPGVKCDPLFTAAAFTEVAIEADRRGLQIAVHAIGDGAVRMVLDGYQAAARANGLRGIRHRIEHIELIHPDDIDRFAALGVIASMQPPHAPGMAGLPLEPTVSRIGEVRWRHAYAWQTLRQTGARMVFGTDWPVSPIDPLLAIECAVTRPVWRDGLPPQAQSLGDTLRSYTHDSAFAERMEYRKGMLRAGMLADLVVLDGDIETRPPATIHEMAVRTTICDGRVVHSADG